MGILESLKKELASSLGMFADSCPARLDDMNRGQLQALVDQDDLARGIRTNVLRRLSDEGLRQVLRGTSSGGGE